MAVGRVSIRAVFLDTELSTNLDQAVCSDRNLLDIILSGHQATPNREQHRSCPPEGLQCHDRVLKRGSHAIRLLIPSSARQESEEGLVNRQALAEQTAVKLFN